MGSKNNGARVFEQDPVANRILALNVNPQFIVRMRSQLMAYIVNSLGHNYFICRNGPQSESRQYLAPVLAQVMKVMEGSFSMDQMTCSDNTIIYDLMKALAVSWQQAVRAYRQSV